MEFAEKVSAALADRFQIDELSLDDDDGLTGYIVSPGFRGTEFIDRQNLIHDALRRPEAALSPADLRRILAIAALTPEEKAPKRGSAQTGPPILVEGLVKDPRAERRGTLGKKGVPEGSRVAHGGGGRCEFFTL